MIKRDSINTCGALKAIVTTYWDICVRALYQLLLFKKLTLFMNQKLMYEELIICLEVKFMVIVSQINGILTFHRY